MVYDEPPGFFHPQIIEQLNHLEACGIAWCTNSGRDFEDQLRVLAMCYRKGLRHRPVAMICSESLIFEAEADTYVPAQPWNGQIESRLIPLQRAVQAVLEPVLDDLHRRHRGCIPYLGEHFTAFLVPDEHDAPARLHAELEQRLTSIEGSCISRNAGWVAVLTQGLGKGNALAEFARRAGIGSGSILAVGDHFNDLSMLDGRVAHHTGCPHSAIGAVKEAVQRAGGWISSEQGPLGTLDVIRRYTARRD